MARPAVTEPPGLLMYMWIGFLADSDCRNNNWATIKLKTKGEQLHELQPMSILNFITYNIEAVKISSRCL